MTTQVHLGMARHAASASAECIQPALLVCKELEAPVDDDGATQLVAAGASRARGISDSRLCADCAQVARDFARRGGQGLVDMPAELFFLVAKAADGFPRRWNSARSHGVAFGLACCEYPRHWRGGSLAVLIARGLG